MTVPLVSVVIPTYNGGALLRAAVDSVLAQDYFAPIEVVVVDDGSTQPVEPLPADLGTRVVRLIRQPNAGTAAARNRGISAARGEYVAFLDHDDLWDADKLSRQIPKFSESEIALVHAGARFVDTTGEVTSLLPGEPGLDVHDLLADCRVAVQTAVVRRTVFDEIGMFDESLSAADDWDMWIRIADRYRVTAIPEPLATIRVHPGNQSRDAELMYGAARRLLAKHAQLHGPCEHCRVARHTADVASRRAYYERLREQARAAGASGDRAGAVRLTARALRRNPRALVTTPAHHLRRLRRGR
jgi:glycosyltransferase involved in cell wall biosynthesis